MSLGSVQQMATDDCACRDSFIADEKDAFVVVPNDNDRLDESLAALVWQSDAVAEIGRNFHFGWQDQPLEQGGIDGEGR